jgi:Citrate transporter
MMGVSANAATWGIAGLATFGVIARPWNFPEFIWAAAGAMLLVLLNLLPWPDALAAAAKGTDVYLFLVGMMLLAEVARKEGLFDWLAAQAVKSAKGSARRLFLIVYFVGTAVTVLLSNDATAVVRLGVFGQRNVAAEHTEHRRLGPVERVGEIQVDRPIPGEPRAGFDLHHRSTLGFAVNAGGEAIGTLAFDGAKNRNRADDVIAAAIKRHRATVDETIDVAIGSDPEHQHALVHAADFLVDGSKPPWYVALDRRGDRRQSEFDRR